ncbi:RIP metalloprotease RseP, partial [Burkholderia pseudomallei]
TPAAVAGFDGGETIVSIRIPGAGGAQGGQAEPVRSWSELRWKLLGAAFDHRDVVLGARNRADGATYDFRVDLHGIADRDVDDDFMSRLGFEPGGGSLTVTSVLPGGAAQRAGLQAGDKLVALDGARIGGSTRFIDDVKAHAGRALALRIERAGAERRVSIVPQAQRDDETGKQVGRIGAALALQTPSVDVRYGVLESVELGARRTWDISVYSLKMFGRMVTGEASLKNLSGPVTIADYAGKSARLGLSAFLSFLALVSISLGVLNLLPIPVLDGGHLLYYLVEAATGKAVSERWQLILQRAGLICIVALSAIALFNDLARLIHF